jgi:hypothetical protein
MCGFSAATIEVLDELGVPYRRSTSSRTGPSAKA